MLNAEFEQKRKFYAGDPKIIENITLSKQGRWYRQYNKINTKSDLKINNSSFGERDFSITNI